MEEKSSDLYKVKEGCYLRTNGIFGPRLVFPAKDSDTGKINWKNFLIGGSWWKFIGMMLVILIVFGLIWSYNHDMAEGIKCLKDPAGYLLNQTMQNFPKIK